VDTRPERRDWNSQKGMFEREHVSYDSSVNIEVPIGCQVQRDVRRALKQGNDVRLGKNMISWSSKQLALENSTLGRGLAELSPATRAASCCNVGIRSES
jgi:hypothetical protein